MSERLKTGPNGTLDLENYGRRLAILANRSDLTPEKEFLLQELQLFGESKVQLLEDSDPNIAMF